MPYYTPVSDLDSYQRAHNAIISLFETICNLEIKPEVLAINTSAEHNPSTSNSSSNTHNVKTLFMDERGRFRIWAKNVGAHRKPNDRASLGYRLREAPHVRSALLEALQRLEKFLIEGLSYEIHPRKAYYSSLHSN